ANCSPDAALTVTVAGWPTLTEPMSDSLRETSILKRLTCARVMKLELPEALEELELAPPPPRPPATLAPPDPVEDDDEEAEDDEPPLTVWPTAPLTAVTVPAMGARRVVAATAFSALWTLSCALSTLAWAAATVIVLVAPEPELELEPESELDPELAPFDPPDCAVVAVVAGVSAWTSASWADCRSASACARATSALAGSTL